MDTMLLVDIEATNFLEPEIIEFAGRVVDINADSTGVDYHEFFNPTRAISFGAMATHNIVHSDLVSCRPSNTFVMPPANIIVGHNVDFDWKAMGSPPVNRICTLGIARRLWPHLDSHKQGAVMYFIMGEAARDLVRGVHNAANDVCMLQIMLKAIKSVVPNLDTPAAWWQLSEACRIPIVMPFGKYRGCYINTLPQQYKNWLLQLDDLDPYLRIALTS